MDLGCLSPRTGRYGSLYNWQYCGPHHSNKGKRFARRNLTIIRRAGDQEATGPIGVLDQSMDRMRDPFRLLPTDSREQ